MRTARTIFVVLLALASAAPAARATESAGGERKSRIAGVVLDANGARIVDAIVRIENADVSRETYTSDEGSFEVELPAGTYRITVVAQGFRTVEIVSFRARADKRESLKVRMKVKPPESTLKIA
ncbi:MAG TPA: carboxypeptidase-like regulatory domain-containing protein [Pyrinomonadaceae bacterium]|nr:carboxypeptidase-like regulatory domain-containing protein [Pyrinomonadaceae bacterium]